MGEPFAMSFTRFLIGYYPTMLEKIRLQQNNTVYQGPSPLIQKVLHNNFDCVHKIGFPAHNLSAEGRTRRTLLHTVIYNGGPTPDPSLEISRVTRVFSRTMYLWSRMHWSCRVPYVCIGVCVWSRYRNVYQQQRCLDFDNKWKSSKIQRGEILLAASVSSMFDVPSTY